MTLPPVPFPLDPLTEVLGVELELGNLSNRLGTVVGAAPMPTKGIVHITCADEAQHHVVEKVQELLVEPHVTPMASGDKTAFRLINLGAYYEAGALTIAEDHWGGAHDPSEGPKLMVVRVDAHVGVDDDANGGDPTYGEFLRFGRTSVACGALAAVLRGQAMPGAHGFMDHEVRARRIIEAFSPRTRMLAAAVCRAELSASESIAEIEHMRPTTPTVWLVVASVTINHPDRHASMLTSATVIDESLRRTGTGLGLDVERYAIHHADNVVHVTRT